MTDNDSGKKHSQTDRKINSALLSPLADRSAPGPSGELAGIALDDILLLRSHDGQCPLPQWAAFRPDARPMQRARGRCGRTGLARVALRDVGDGVVRKGNKTGMPDFKNIKVME